MTEQQFEHFAAAVGAMGASMQEVVKALNALNEALNTRLQQQAQNQTIINQLSELRPALDATTENPNQKSDLENLNAIEWDEKFLKFLNEPLNLDF